MNNAWFAQLYDDFAEEWGGAEAWPAILDLAEEHVAQRRLGWLDVGCGTGRFLAEVVARRWTARGLDLDPAMCTLARTLLPQTPIDEADMTDFALKRNFNVISCLGGSLNILGQPARIQAALATMLVHLAPGGLLLLDTNTPAGLAQWDEWGMADPSAERPFIIEGSYDLTTSQAAWAITLFVPDSHQPQLYQRHTQTITQRAIDESELIDWLTALPTIQSIQCLDAYTGQPPTDHTTRLLTVVLRSE